MGLSQTRVVDRNKKMEWENFGQFSCGKINPSPTWINFYFASGGIRWLQDENVELEEEHDEDIEVSNGQEENLQQVDNVELEEEHDEEIDVSNGQEENLHQVDENESDGESKLGIYSREELLIQGLGLTTENVPKVKKGHVTLEWLRKTFSNTPEDATAEIVDCHVRAYLLFLLGCTIFNDKSGVGVHIAYLQVLLEVDNVSKYAWAATVLAYLYRELAKASQQNRRQVAGCMTLLEAWVYEHFPLQNSPMINMDFKRDMPRMRRWMVYPSLSMATVSSLIYLREEIDLLSAREVYWDPYKDVCDIRPLDDVTFFNGVLCVLDIVEGYNIDRVLSQVGYGQRIPSMPIQPKYGSKKTNVRYNVNHHTFSRLWTSGNNHVLSKFERDERVVASSDCVNRYIDWFNNISHPCMRNPKHFSQVHRLPPVNWLDIGGTQDVHGMLAREKMIYNILQFQQIIQESSRSRGGGENSGDVGENSGGGQDNGGDGGENSGDNMDIDTTKLTKRQLAMRQKRKK
ncbi:hypothetical protein IFM89_023208 [Coptis chinensis]|uniref:Aminotransferase-like plant mobile domain-containing protein n=1 Tax=Coptis chinensis TaxID=261450 RepID=A0A835I788_9MAGN|nr:hypothetical protein IFM89_023208 [Coptis chinensis]